MTTRGAAVRLGALVVIFGLVILIASQMGLGALSDPAVVLDTVERVRGIPYITLLFVAAYAVVAAVGLPATPFTLAGGALFGVGLGTVLNWSGATLGASGTFLLARMIGGDSLRKVLGKHARHLDLLTDSRAFGTLLRLRFVPVMPFNMLSLAASLAGITFRPYVLATALGILPGTFIYTWFADSVLAGVAGASSAALRNLLIASVALLAISFAPALIKRVQGARAEPSQ